MVHPEWLDALASLVAPAPVLSAPDDLPSCFSATGRPEALIPSKPLKRQPNLSCAACPGGATPRHTLLYEDEWATSGSALTPKKNVSKAHADDKDKEEA